MRFAFLRGINLGGRRVKNDELVAILQGMGLDDVSAYQAAGNLAFRGDTDADRLAGALGDALSYEVPVILRSADDLRAIAEATPFTAAQQQASGGKVQVILLAQTPTKRAREAALALASDDDLLHLDGSELYWLPTHGVGRSQLDNGALQKALGLQTCRTQGTLQRMAKKYLG